MVKNSQNALLLVGAYLLSIEPSKSKHMKQFPISTTNDIVDKVIFDSDRIGSNTRQNNYTETTVLYRFH